MGLTHFVSDSEGKTVENPRCFERAAKQHLKIARQRKDHAHKTARNYV